MSNRLNLDDNCPGCGMSWGLFPPARVDEDRGIDRHPRFAPGPYVRCVDCKRTYLRPMPIVPQQQARENPK